MSWDFVWQPEGTAGIAADCPACGHAGPHAPVLVIPGAGLGGADWRVLRCAGCATRFSADRRVADYGGDGGEEGPALDFYLEQSAGIDAMLTPLAWARPGGGRRLLEIGGGCGFVSDFAERALGWTAKGYDPSPLARMGRRLLGLDIELDYFTDDTPLPRPYDVVYASEVIEHVPDPEAFVRTIARGCGEDGVVVLTTPNGEALHPGTSPATLIPIASPGMHLTLFTAGALEALLRRCGFAHAAVAATPTALRAIASRVPLPDWERPLDRALYRDYLHARAGDAGGSPRLASGMRYRLFKALVNEARYAEALPVFDALAAAARDAYGLDLAAAGHPGEGGGLEALARRQPFNLTGLYYFRAVVAANLEQDPAAAARFALAAAETGAVLRAALQAAGLDDGETEDLTRQAALLALTFLPGRDAGAAADLFRRLARHPRTFGLTAEELERARRPLVLALTRQGALRALAAVLRTTVGTSTPARAAPDADGDAVLPLVRSALAQRDWHTVADLAEPLAPGDDRFGRLLALARCRMAAEAADGDIDALAGCGLAGAGAPETGEIGRLFTDLVAAGRAGTARRLLPVAVEAARAGPPETLGSVLLAAGMVREGQPDGLAEAAEHYAAAAAAFAGVRGPSADWTRLEDEARARARRLRLALARVACAEGRWADAAAFDPDGDP
ncbi:MAG TPA: class I SAM-dependent methyltransferase, partial [Azospirillaceae bacterium]|nr:class I SAM-dependent methyltransferase [Azospirillaceae bacterium]